MRQSDDQESPFAVSGRGAALPWPGRMPQGADLLGAALGETLADHARGLGTGRVLDFGAGSGRVAAALGRRMAGAPSDACEADPAALAAALPHVRCVAAGAAPPLPYEGGAFGAVYAADAFLHLPPSRAVAWLGEIARVMQEGGVALVAVCGPGGLHRRRAAHRPGWIAVADADLARTGALYLPLGRRAGGGEFGLTAYSHAHLVAAWDEVLPIEAIYEAAGPDGEDFVVLRKPPPGRATGPAARLGEALKAIWRRRAR